MQVLEFLKKKKKRNGPLQSQLYIYTDHTKLCAKITYDSASIIHFISLYFSKILFIYSFVTNALFDNGEWMRRGYLGKISANKE